MASLLNSLDTELTRIKLRRKRNRGGRQTDPLQAAPHVAFWWKQTQHTVSVRLPCIVSGTYLLSFLLDMTCPE